MSTAVDSDTRIVGGVLQRQGGSPWQVGGASRSHVHESMSEGKGVAVMHKGIYFLGSDPQERWERVLWRNADKPALGRYRGSLSTGNA